MSDTFTDFELAALRASCESDPGSKIALDQLHSARLVKRNRTGHGLFVHFEVDKSVGPIKEAHGRILLGSEKICLTHPKLAHGGDVIVWLEDGFIDCLETYVFGEETWPDEEEASFVIEKSSAG